MKALANVERIKARLVMAAELIRLAEFDLLDSRSTTAEFAGRDLLRAQRALLLAHAEVSSGTPEIEDLLSTLPERRRTYASAQPLFVEILVELQAVLGVTGLQVSSPHRTKSRHRTATRKGTR